MVVLRGGLHLPHPLEAEGYCSTVFSQVIKLTIPLCVLSSDRTDESQVAQETWHSGVSMSGYLMVVFCCLEATPPGLFDDGE